MGADGDAADASGAAGEAAAMVHIRCSNGSKFSVQTALDATVGALKAALVERCDVPALQQRLIYKGRILKDDQTLQSYGLESDHTIHLVRGAALPSSPTNVAPSIPNSTSWVARDTNNLGGSFAAGFGGPGFGDNGLGGTGSTGLFGSGFPEFDQVQEQLSQNPNMMREIMNMPMFQNLMNNPDILRNFIMNNPQMRDIIDRNPDLAHILNDPNTLRQTLEVARNPELMREMMRNTDRAMSNIESSPEGFNMLRRMYETVQEPFLNATAMTGDAGSDLGSNPFAALLGNQRTATQLPNPSTTGSEATTGSPAPNTNPLPNPWGNAGVQTANTGSTAASNARTGNIAGFGGLILPGLDSIAGSMPDASQLSQLMQNPVVAQAMQSILSNPQHLNQLLSLNPQMRSLLESNPQLSDMLQNPEFLLQMTSRESLQQLLSLQTFMSLLSRQQPGQDHNQAGGGLGTPDNAGLDFLMNLFGGLGAGGLGAPSNPNVPPEQLYATQLSQLQEMGFFDTQENIRALAATAGNVHAAVERLLRDATQ